MFDISISIQIFGVIWTISLIGFLCGKFSLFTSQDSESIRRLIYLVAIPAMMFKFIGNYSFSKITWLSLLHAILFQIILHLIISFLVFIFPTDQKSRKMIRSLICGTELDFIYIGYPICQLLFTENEIIYPILATFIQNLIIIPFHSFLISKFTPKTPEDSNLSIDQNNNNEENEEVELDDQKINNVTGNPIDSDGIEEEKIEDIPKNINNEEIPLTKFQIFLKELISPINICSILGIIWSITKIQMPKFLNSFVTDLSKSVIAAGLFIIGLNISRIPFLSGCPIEITFNIIFHSIINPIISKLISNFLNLPLNINNLLTLCYLSPTSLSGFILTDNCSLKNSTAQNMFLWSQLLTFPILIIWTFILNK